jgi:CheY-like chemotaxis protein
MDPYLSVGPFIRVKNKKTVVFIRRQKMSRTILDVDDDLDVLEARKIVLEHNGFNVFQATNIKVALEILENEKIELIILDVMMEKNSDGFNFAQRIKMDERFKQIPIVMATAVNQRTAFTFDVEKDGAFLPVEKFMEKPIDPDDLIKAVNGLLGN